MAEPNDGRIPGGPITDAIKQERETHISTLVFNGKAILGQQYIQEPQSYLWPHGREWMRDILTRVDSLSLGRDPDMPPLHTRIPADYPAATVPLRTSRRRRVDDPEDEEGAAGEGTSQEYHGEGTSQQYHGEGSSQQYHGEGSSQQYHSQQYAPEYPSQQYAPEYPSQQYAPEFPSQQYAAEYPSQPYAAEYTTPHYAGEGLSQQYVGIGSSSAFQPYNQRITTEQVNTAAAYSFEGMSYYSQLFASPSAPVPTQEVEEEDERRAEETTDERRARLGLRQVERRRYKRMARRRD